MHGWLGSDGEHAAYPHPARPRRRPGPRALRAGRLRGVGPPRLGGRHRPRRQPPAGPRRGRRPDLPAVVQQADPDPGDGAGRAAYAARPPRARVGQPLGRGLPRGRGARDARLRRADRGRPAEHPGLPGQRGGPRGGAALRRRQAPDHPELLRQARRDARHLRRQRLGHRDLPRPGPPAAAGDLADPGRADRRRDHGRRGRRLRRPGDGGDPRRPGPRVRPDGRRRAGHARGRGRRRDPGQPGIPRRHRPRRHRPDRGDARA